MLLRYEFWVQILVHHRSPQARNRLFHVLVTDGGVAFDHAERRPAVHAADGLDIESLPDAPACTLVAPVVDREVRAAGGPDGGERDRGRVGAAEGIAAGQAVLPGMSKVIKCLPSTWRCGKCDGRQASDGP